MPERTITPTHSAFLELRDERESMREGYGFLDEKRLILASEILAELQRYEQEMDGFRQAHRIAAGRLQAAVARHGLEGLELYPKEDFPCRELEVEGRSALGVVVQKPAWSMSESQAPAPAANASPEGDACRDAFADMLPRAARLAVLTGNLERLRLEYTRTERRARALEDVLLPEIEDDIKTIDAALEELEREEAMRVRHVHRTP